MSQSCHRLRAENGISKSYFDKELGPWKACHRPGCSGVLLDVYASYQKNGKVYKELECCACGKTVKNYKDVSERQKDKENRKRQSFKNKGRSRLPRTIRY